MVSGGRIVHQLFEDPLEVGEGIGSVAAHLLDEGVNDRTAPTGFLAADEHPVLVTQLGGPDGVFGQIMPRPDLCRVRKLKARIPVVRHSIPYSHAA